MESEAELLTLDGDDAPLCNDSSEALPAVENCGQKEKSNNSVIAKIESYLRSYLSFPNERYFLPLALFAVLMHCWDECFDEVPYISVGASVKSAGKTRLLELLSFLAGVVRAILVDGSVTLAALYTEIDSGKILLIDESERLHNPRSQFRPILNGGYRRGQTTLRKISGQNQQFSIYCPKVFSHIGDLHDSLRDRCILVQMQRTMGGSRKEYNRAEAQADGNDIGQMIEEAVSGKLDDIKDAYSDYHELYPTLDFLRDRDKEIWKPLFSLCQVFAPSRVSELERSAIDISTLKTLPIRRFDMLKDEEEKLRKMEYAEQVLRDSIRVIGDRDRITTAALIDGLRALGTSPWRSYDGSGLTDMSLASLVKLFGVEPKTIRFKPKGEANSTAKGYLRTDLMAGAERAGVVPPMQNSGNPVTLAGESEAGCDDCLATAATPDTGCDGLHQCIVELAEANSAWNNVRFSPDKPANTATSEFATNLTVTAATFNTQKTATTAGERSQYSTSSSTAAYYASSSSNEWYTPSLYVEAVREVFDGRIQLDPASCSVANAVVRAEQYFSLAEDGLAQPWIAGTLFLNPPYRGQAGVWAQRLIYEYESGNVGQAILLVYACTSESWFRPLYTYPICFAEKRLRFYGPDGKGYTAPRGSAFVYLGNDPARFTSVFSNLGQVVVPIRASDAAQPETHSGTVMTSEHVQGLEPTSTTVTAVEVADAEPAPAEVGTATAAADELELEVNSGHANVVEDQMCTPGTAETGKVLAEPQTKTDPDIPEAQVIQVGTSAVFYLPSFLPSPDVWWQSLSALPWTPENLKRSGKPITSKRETIHFGIPYDLDSASKPPLPWDGGILCLGKLLERRAGRKFEQCTCYRYHGGVGIACHRDTQYPLFVASISFGATRQMGFCPHDKSSIDESLPLITLVPGSLVLFTNEFNELYKHGILEDKSVNKPRISVTFRHFA